MTPRERFRSALDFRPVDRLPAMEWICWWDKTVERWRSEGLPPELGREDLLRWFGLDVHEWIWLSPRYNRSFRAALPPGHERSRGVIESEADYDRLAAPVLAAPVVDRVRLERIAAQQARGEAVVWLQLDGFFWFPREMFGVERHLYAFYDQPELMHRMNRELCDYNLACLRQVLEVLSPDVLTFAEDLSYNHGPMLSREQFEEFVAPHYRRIAPIARAAGAVPMVDTDGDVAPAIPWFEGAGIEGCLPLERMAGVDVNELRRRHPRWRMIGGFDKTVMHRGEAAVRAEFERLLPAMSGGGFIPTTDHQTPPEVGLEAYRGYVRLLHEYCHRAAGG